MNEDELYFDYAQKNGLKHDPAIHPPSWKTKDQLQVDEMYKGKTEKEIIDDLIEYPDSTPPSWIDPDVIKALDGRSGWPMNDEDKELFKTRPDIKELYEPKVRPGMKKKPKGKAMSALDPEELIARGVSGTASPEEMKMLHGLMRQG